MCEVFWRKVLQGTLCVCCIWIKIMNWGFFVFFTIWVVTTYSFSFSSHLLLYLYTYSINAWVYFIFILCCFVSRRTTLFSTLNPRTFFSYILTVALVSANGFKWGKLLGWLMIFVNNSLHKYVNPNMCACSLAGYVEVLATKFGMQGPELTPKQADMWQTRVSSHMVRNSFIYSS